MPAQMDETPTLPFSAAAERNKGPILKVLRSVLPERARVLEVASGTGQHAAHFAGEMPQWQWQPSEGDASLLLGIKQRCGGLPNVAPPVRLEVLSRSIPAFAGARFDALFCANLLHIAPWTVTAALMRLASRQVVRGGWVLVYGPFEVEGEKLAPSNAAFDADLRARDARWGLRRLAEVQRVAGEAGLEFERRVPMPANNLILVWRRPGPGPA
jgi:SAM-dependent methyltransferase